MLRILLAALLPLVAVADDVSIRYADGAYQVVGWKATSEPRDGWKSVFTVSMANVEAPPVLGAYTVDGGVLTFRPRWPIEGDTIVVRFQAMGVKPIEEMIYPSKTKAAPSTQVSHIYPSAADLPSNTLRLYLYFSAPMSRGEAWGHIHLLDEKGAPVELPFLEIDQELWDPGYTRLTVLFDPGRIKRGLVPLAESGPNMVEGRAYTLVIDADWKDAKGQPLVEGYRKAVRVGPADRRAVETSSWRVDAPKAGAAGALVITFPKPLDFALAARMISVKGVDGTVELVREEREWRFTPRAQWQAGDYQLIVNTALEDVAGNRVGRPFDVDTFTEVKKELRTETVTVPFRIQ